MGDVTERGRWDEYMDAYEDMIRETATKEAPWYVVPADNKTFARLVVAAAMIEALGEIDPKIPQIANTPELQKVRKALLNEGVPKTKRAARAK